jgi:hypothetical protein
MSIFFSLAGGVGVDGGGVGVDEDAVVGFVDTAVEVDGFPLTWTDPKDLTPPLPLAAPAFDIAGVAAGDDEIGAETSSMDPNVTAEPICC